MALPVHIGVLDFDAVAVPPNPCQISLRSAGRMED